MIDLDNILEEKDIIIELAKKNLLKQYKSVKNKILSGNLAKSDLKQRKPTWSGIYSFRINKKFRAFGYIRDWKLIIVEINNHQ